ncbi:MAG: helix-turn-helix transcriptional regulator [Acidobacteriaceae bacterium]|nr:helix-turn-helix transcriptional regulator [Acidobacteriaceae bacterium]MBV9764249.1 helix-turn-helix transcriptional regulator [Acidobacteriaceae bacterium]
MESKTITQGLKRYSIGQKLRRLRLRKSMGLIELSRHTGLSPSLLSKLERDLMHPTLPTLLRIALVFSVGLDYFFNPEPRPVLEVMRKRDRLRFPEASGVRHPTYYFESLDFLADNRKLNAYYAEFEAAERSHVRKHEHAGIEFLYVISGKVALQIGEDELELAEEDAIYFESTVPHGYRKVGVRRTAALVVVTV